MEQRNEQYASNVQRGQRGHDAHDAHNLALRQLDEWATQQNLWGEAMGDRDLDLAKLAKVLAECLKIRHEGERKALAASASAAADSDDGEVSVAWQ